MLPTMHSTCGRNLCFKHITEKINLLEASLTVLSEYIFCDLYASDL